MVDALSPTAASGQPFWKSHCAAQEFGRCETRQKLLCSFPDSNNTRKAGQALLAETPNP